MWEYIACYEATMETHAILSHLTKLRCVVYNMTSMKYNDSWICRYNALYAFVT